MNEAKRILIVDDEPKITHFLSLTLHQSGKYVVREVNNPGDALDSAFAFSPDLVLMDVMMPQVDGGELAARFRATPEFKNIPIVFLTGAVRKQEVSERGGIVGGLPFLAKPVEISQVIDCIEHHIPR